MKTGAELFPWALPWHELTANNQVINAQVSPCSTIQATWKNYQKTIGFPVLGSSESILEETRTKTFISKQGSKQRKMMFAIQNLHLHSFEVHVPQDEL